MLSISDLNNGEAFAIGGFENDVRLGVVVKAVAKNIPLMGQSVEVWWLETQESGYLGSLRTVEKIPHPHAMYREVLVANTQRAIDQMKYEPWARK